jgi:hypothetical protein
MQAGMSGDHDNFRLKSKRILAPPGSSMYLYGKINVMVVLGVEGSNHGAKESPL